MPLAQHHDVVARLRRPLTPDEALALDGLLTEADALLTGYLGTTFEDGAVPSGVTVVASRMAARALEARPGDAGLQSVQVGGGPFQATRTYTPGTQAGGVWLTKQDKVMLRPWRSGMVSVPMVTEHSP